MQDILIIGGGAAGLFCAANLPKHLKKTILEKSPSLGNRLLLSGGSRCNFSNANITPLNDYFGQNKKALPSLFHSFGNQEMVHFLQSNNIQTKQEDSGRLILNSNQAKELNNFLITTAQNNNTDIQFNQTITHVTKTENGFTIITTDQQFETKNLIVATGGISFPQIGATDFGLELAKQFGLEVVEPAPGLCGIETNEDLSELTGNTVIATIQLLFNNKTIYQQTGNLLFTHRGISGPIVFNTTNALQEHKQTKKIGKESFQNYSIRLTLDPQTTIKKISSFFKLTNNQDITLSIKGLRPREESKVMVGGIHMNEIKPTMESKKVPGLYFIGEVLDITGKTGGYNLQRCRTSAYACAKGFIS